MRQYLNAYTVANEVMLRKGFRKAPFILFENLDCEQLPGLSDIGVDYETVIAHSNNNAVGAIDILLHNGCKDVIAIVHKFSNDNLIEKEDVNARVFRYSYQGGYDAFLLKQLEVALKRIEEESNEATSLNTMIASEQVLRRGWDTPEEDEAWADL